MTAADRPDHAAPDARAVGGIFDGISTHLRPCDICGEGVLCAELGGASQRVEYHDCKPVPGAKLEAAEAELARLRAERDNLDRELRASTKRAIDALGTAIVERDALRADLREANYACAEKQAIIERFQESEKRDAGELARLRERVSAADLNAEVMAQAVPSLLNLLQAATPGNYVEMTATAADGIPVVITYQRGDRPTAHELRARAEAERDAATTEAAKLRAEDARRAADYAIELDAIRATAWAERARADAATTEAEKLRTQLREAKIDAEKAKAERNRVHIELHKEWSDKVLAAIARGDRTSARITAVMDTLRPLMPAGHDGDEETGTHDPDCEKCAWEAAVAMLAALAEEITP